GLLTIGGSNGNSSKLILNEKTQTVDGLASVNNNTRQLINKNNNTAASGPAGTLIIDVEEGVNRNFGAAYGVSATGNYGNFNTVKNGLGLQVLKNVHVGGSVTVNAGTLTLGGISGGLGVQIGSASVTAATLNFVEDATIASTLSVDNGGSLGVSVSETDGSTTATGVTFGPTGSVDLTLDYGLLTGIPSYPGIDVTGLDGFSPSSTAITVNIEGNGLAVSQIELIKYNNSAPLADIANFTLGTLPAGIAAVLVNNTANQSIDLMITEAVQSRVWSGDTTIDGVGDWDIATSLNWDTNTTDYTNLYPTFGIGDSVTFNGSVLDIDTGAAEVNLTTTLSPASVTVNNTAAAAYTFSGTGKLSGTMSLNKLGTGTLTISNTTGTNDYTGGTTITTGTILAGVDDALPTGGVVTIGGSGSSILELNGKNLTIGGLETTGDNTRLLRNNGVTNSTLTIDVADAEDYFYGSNFTGTGTIDLVKNGTGTQRFTKDGFNTPPQSLTVNNGLLVWDTLNATVATATVAGGTLQLGDTFSPSPIGDVTVNSGASLVFNGSANATSVTVDAGSTASLNWKVGDWAGVAGTDWPQIAISGNLAVNSGAASFTVVIDDSTISNFTEANTSFTIATVGGTATAAASDFTVNQSGFTTGAGTFALSLSGSDLLLTYTAPAASSAYDAWVAANYPGLTGGFDGNDDGDALTNGQEWYFGGSDPLVADSTGQPLVAVESTGAGTFTFTHLRPTDISGASANYKWSAALEDGFTANGATDGTYTTNLTAGATTPDVTGYESVVVTVTSSPAASSIFARVVLNMLP
ncbi:MAG: hypothetical protein ABF315_06130, partial [Lentimonas sp.]